MGWFSRLFAPNVANLKERGDMEGLKIACHHEDPGISLAASEAILDLTLMNEAEILAALNGGPDQKLKAMEELESVLPEVLQRAAGGPEAERAEQLRGRIEERRDTLNRYRARLNALRPLVKELLGLQAFLGADRTAARSCGEKIHDIWGMKGMRMAHATVRGARGAAVASELESAWDNIGEWRG